MQRLDHEEPLSELGRRPADGSLGGSDHILAMSAANSDFRILPWANVVKIGGQSIIDRGHSAVMPLIDEIVENLPRHKMILGTGAGTRARHVYSLAIELGLPVGVLTVLGTAVAWQNAQLLHYLLARHGIAFLEPEGFASLPHYLMERGAVICQGMPPYKLWESNPEVGRIPPERTDTGCFLMAEAFGAERMIYVKDEDGLFTADPKKDSNARHIPHISVQELLARDLNDLIVERAVLKLMLNARHISRIQFVNGLRRGELTAALDGEEVGTIIFNEAVCQQPRRAGRLSRQVSSKRDQSDGFQNTARSGPARADQLKESRRAPSIPATPVEAGTLNSGAHHVFSALMRESLMDKSVIARTEAPITRILPNLNVIQIGGSIIDKGHSAVLPLLDEIARNQKEFTQVVGVGPGVRARHILSVGLDLGLPTGALATLAAKASAQNAYMISCLLARHGFVYLEAPFIVQLLPAMLAAARGAVFNGIPPYDLWEHPPSIGKLPPHGSDAGSYLLGEVFGARSIILLKDVDGLYTADPKTHPEARLIPDIGVAELLGMRLPSLPIEPVVLELLSRAKLAKTIQVVNGLVSGNLSRALKGESVGSAIHL